MVRLRPNRGEIWLVDLGLAQKTRPVVILSVQPEGEERVVITYVARTTSIRGTRFEISHEAPGFKPGVFDAQSIGTIPTARLMKRIGAVREDTMAAIQETVRSWLRL
jgi:mRNA interferase MazF